MDLVKSLKGQFLLDPTPRHRYDTSRMCTHGDQGANRCPCDFVIRIVHAIICYSIGLQRFCNTSVLHKQNSTFDRKRHSCRTNISDASKSQSRRRVKACKKLPGQIFYASRWSLYVGVIGLFCMTGIAGEVVVLTNEPAAFEFHSEFNETVNIVRGQTGIVGYVATLQKHRQLIEVSKVLDNTELSLANHNIQHSNLKSAPSITDGFKIHRTNEYYMSKDKYTNAECALHCAARQSELLSNLNHFTDLKEVFDAPVWVHCDTKLTDNGDYEIFLDTHMVYPKNRFNNGSVTLLHQNNNELEWIDNIRTYYPTYYNSQTKKWWPTASYRMLCVLGPKGSVKILLPTPTTILPCVKCITYCGCVKPLSLSRKILHEYNAERLSLKIQQRKMNLGIEPIRTLTGNIFKIVYPRERHELEVEVTHDNSTYNMSDVKELSITEPNTTNRLMMASAITFTVKTVGFPLLKEGFKYMIKKKAERYNKSLTNYFRSNDIRIPKTTKLVGLSSETDTFRLKIKFDKIENYISPTSLAVHDQTILISNLSYANERFDEFLKNQAVETLMSLALKDVNCIIDKTVPVMVTVKQQMSFQVFTFGFSCVVEPSITQYRMFSLPHARLESQLQAVKVPEKFSATSYQFNFPNIRDDTAQMRKCVNGILTNVIAGDCEIHDFSLTQLRIILVLEHFNILYVSSYDSSSHIQVQCPLLTLQNFELRHDIGVMMISPACAVGLHTAAGTLSLKGNSTYTGQIHHPRMLITYNLYNMRTQSYYNTILLIVVTVVLVVFVVTAGVTYYMICVRKVERVTISDTDDTTSEGTITGIQFGSGRHVRFTGPSTL